MLERFEFKINWVKYVFMNLGKRDIKTIEE